MRTVPVLVEGAQMPSSADLPESIRRLARINAIELDDRRWVADMERLAAVIEGFAREELPRPVPTRPAASSTDQDGGPGSAPANMRFVDVDEDAVQTGVAAMPATFRTKDLSQAPSVLRAHPHASRLPNYHTVMGRYLAKHHDALSLHAAEPAADDQGAVWQKRFEPARTGSLHVDGSAGAGPAIAARNRGPSPVEAAPRSTGGLPPWVG